MRTLHLKAKPHKSKTPYIIAGVACLAVGFSLLQPQEWQKMHYQPMKIESPQVQAMEYTPPDIDGKRKQAKDLQAVYAFIESYPDSRLTREYINAMYSACGDVETVKQAVAIATAETGQGKSTPLSYNFFGWHLNGNKWHDPDMETMAKQITEGIQLYYSEVGNNASIADVYTGGDNTSTWMNIYQWAIAQM